jgi:murein L,D-transpeptidase YafK
MSTKTLSAALLAAALALTFTSPSASRPVPGVTEIRVHKADHTLELVAGDDVVKSYRVAIGPGGAGPKRMEGDKVTPVGTYRISGRIKGLFHNFLVVSYPNAADVARYGEAKRRGEIPAGVGIGGGIGIHGVGSDDWKGVHKERDWTLGCIALDDDEIDEVAASAKDGTKLVITD